MARHELGHEVGTEPWPQVLEGRPSLLRRGLVARESLLEQRSIALPGCRVSAGLTPSEERCPVPERALPCCVQLPCTVSQTNLCPINSTELPFSGSH